MLYPHPFQHHLFSRAYPFSHVLAFRFAVCRASVPVQCEVRLSALSPAESCDFFSTPRSVYKKAAAHCCCTTTPSLSSLELERASQLASSSLAGAWRPTAAQRPLLEAARALQDGAYPHQCTYVARRPTVVLLAQGPHSSAFCTSRAGCHHTGEGAILEAQGGQEALGAADWYSRVS